MRKDNGRLFRVGVRLRIRVAVRVRVRVRDKDRDGDRDRGSHIPDIGSSSVFTPRQAHGHLRFSVGFRVRVRASG